MSEKRKGPKEEQQGAPLYMLSFADMMTNVLCFFILLCAFAEERQVGIITDGVASIRKALMAAGLPGVMSGDREPVEIGADKVLFRPAESISPELLVDSDGRLTDRNRQALREVLVNALESDQESVIPVSMLFKRGSAELTRDHQIFLSEVALRAAGGSFRIRVEGYASTEGLSGVDAEWNLALERTQKVISYLAEVGDISRKRFERIAYGPVRGTSTRELTEQQKRWGRRVVLLTFLEG